VVGDDVEQLAEAVCRKGSAEPGVARLTPQLGVDAGVVDDVVAVGATWRRLQVGGGVEMADSELGQVVTDGGGLVEAEVGCELQAIRGPQARDWGVDLANATVSTGASSGRLSPAPGVPLTHPTKPTGFAGTPRKPASRGGESGEYPAQPGEGASLPPEAVRGARESHSTLRSSTSERSTTGTWPPAR
jgi:hypothetical protein